MKILLAPDKFKGVLTARQAAECMAAGILETLPEAQLQIEPVADGGEGTAQVLGDALGGIWQECEAHDLNGRMARSRYVWLPERALAVMEMSEVAGLKHVGGTTRNIEEASTCGVGEMMLHAANLGAREIIVGVGGSMTNDGGNGMARALGFRFFDRTGVELKGAVTELRTLAHIETKGVAAIMQDVRVIAAADVRNPLLGPNGATRVFGPQKGASDEQVKLLEDALETLAGVVARDLGADNRSIQGAGAGGGLAFGLMSFCGATIRPGFTVVAEAIDLEKKIRGADVVVTGEGSLDRQTLDGKAPAEVARMARRAGKRVFALVGRTDGDAGLGELFDGIFAVAEPSRSEVENVAHAGELLRNGAKQFVASLGAAPR